MSKLQRGERLPPEEHKQIVDFIKEYRRSYLKKPSVQILETKFGRLSRQSFARLSNKAEIELLEEKISVK